jgi:hypothetical protein
VRDVNIYRLEERRASVVESCSKVETESVLWPIPSFIPVRPLVLFSGNRL